jgi:hypothetical protein
LHQVFPAVKGRNPAPAGELLRKERDGLLKRVAHWSGLQESEVEPILAKLEDRAEVLDLQYSPKRLTQVLMDVTALATALAMDFAYTGQLTG